ncbi:hypothetical protein L1987_85766 [Smallanthus sonchifolius]|uniref:Uncharacterized protein n=1 Tax=Smallanthus sonchifolius TaxID=185202 RepID=A0ACB8XY16_9ASTR|nr:hypothetical protein L1987_85766 [Smallanthus sonchifolius]
MEPPTISLSSVEKKLESRSVICGMKREKAVIAVEPYASEGVNHYFYYSSPSVLNKTVFQTLMTIIVSENPIP